MALKCAQDSCNNQVSPYIGHKNCARRRACFNDSKYDPEACEICLTHWSNIKDNNELASDSKKTLKSLIRKMYDSNSFKRNIKFVNEEFKLNHWDLVSLKSRSRRKSKSSKSN